MKKLYPIIFNPVFTYRMWGGEKLKTVLNKKYTETNIGESWEISAVSGSETKVASGDLKGKTIKDLIADYGAHFLGKNVYDRFGGNFPLLIKYIDAKKPLSIQVHPSDELAKKRHNSFGKNEMWYVMQADKDAELIMGFDTKVSKNEYVEALDGGAILDILHSERVGSGDVFNIPTGRVHAIGAGVLLAEIQQTSDVTYRIYDYERVDARTGEQRELHTDLALDAINFTVEKNYKTPYTLASNQSVELIHNPFFKTDILELNGVVKKDMTETDSFVIYMCVEGESTLTHEDIDYDLPKGSSVLVPASLNIFSLSGEGRLLEVTI